MFSTPRLIAAAAALAIVVAVVVWIYRQGGDEVRTSIERQNNKAGRTADDVRSRFDLCPAGMWNFGAGKCRLSPASGGRLAESPDPPYFGAEVPVNDGGSYHVTGRSERGRWPLDRATGNSARVFLEQCRFEYRKPWRSLSVMQVWP